MNGILEHDASRPWKAVGLAAAALAAAAAGLNWGRSAPGGPLDGLAGFGLVFEQNPSGLPEEEAWRDLVRAMVSSSLAYQGRVGVYLKDLKTGRTWTHHADDLFISASLVKTPVMAAVFRKVHNGELTLSTQVKLRRADRVGGSGSIKWYQDGTRFTVRELLERMISESDNTAMRMLIHAVGLDHLQTAFQEFGLIYTQIHPEGLSLSTRPVKYENYTTAREMASLLERMYRGEMVDRFSSEMMVELLKRHRTRSRLAKGLPIGWEIAHKGGLLRRACHDAGIVFSPEGDYVLVVLTGQNRNYGAAKNFLSKMAHLTFKYYKGDTAYLARLSQRAGNL